MDVEVRRSQHAPQSHPKREKHFRAARVADVAEVNNVAGLPAEPFAKPVCDFALGLRVIATDEQVVITWDPRWINHDSVNTGPSVRDYSSGFGERRTVNVQCLYRFQRIQPIQSRKPCEVSVTGAKNKPVFDRQGRKVRVWDQVRSIH